MKHYFVHNTSTTYGLKYEHGQSILMVNSVKCWIIEYILAVLSSFAE